MTTRRTVVVALLLALAAACGRARPTRFFTLHTLADDPGPLPSPVRVVESIGVGPVTVPDYLQRPQLASRVSATELRFAEFARWGEPLAQGIARTLTANIQVLLAADRVIVFPWDPLRAPAATVAVDVVRFEKMPEPEVELLARWTVRRRGEPGAVMRETRLREATGDDDPAQVVAALARALTALSREIAETIAREARALPG